VCVRCGLTRDFYSDEFDELGLPNSVKALGRVEKTRVEARGVCLACVAKEKAKRNIPSEKRG
jgi:Fur family peroxide stress response transcriptional regulator